MSITNVSVGQKLHGYCNGYFGRDSFFEKTIVAIGTYNQRNWVVVTESYYMPGDVTPREIMLFADGFSNEEIEEWADKKATLLKQGYSEEEIKELYGDI